MVAACSNQPSSWVRCSAVSGLPADTAFVTRRSASKMSSARSRRNVRADDILVLRVRNELTDLSAVIERLKFAHAHIASIHLRIGHLPEDEPKFRQCGLCLCLLITLQIPCIPKCANFNGLKRCNSLCERC